MNIDPRHAKELWRRFCQTRLQDDAELIVGEEISLTGPAPNASTFLLAWATALDGTVPQQQLPLEERDTAAVIERFPAALIVRGLDEPRDWTNWTAARRQRYVAEQSNADEYMDGTDVRAFAATIGVPSEDVYDLGINERMPFLRTGLFVRRGRHIRIRRGCEAGVVAHLRQHHRLGAQIRDWRADPIDPNGTQRR